MTVVYPDVVDHILDHLFDDPGSLYNCLLVDHGFRNSAAKVLYKEVTYSPAYTPVLDLRKKGLFMQGKVSAACLSHHAPHVLRFELSGYLYYRPHMADDFRAEVQAAVRSWINLHTVALTPKLYEKDLFIVTLPLLPSLAHIQGLTVNASCTGDAHAPVLVRTEHLGTLSILNPTRAILDCLPEWLSRLSSSLRRFHLRDNCGSVGPGVLRAILPHLQRVWSFSMGLSYSVTNDDIFGFLNQLPDLRELEFRYYLQLRDPSVLPRLSRLESVSVRYGNVATTQDAVHLCKWTRRLVSRSPIVTFHLICETPDRRVSVAFDGLVDSLALRHAAALRVVRMDNAFVGRKALLQLISRCPQLEELGAAITADTLSVMPEAIRHSARLHTLVMEMRNIKPRYVVVDDGMARGFFHEGKTALRRLTISSRSWEGLWMSSAEREVRFVVVVSDVPRKYQMGG